MTAKVGREEEKEKEKVLRPRIEHQAYQKILVIL